ncbi:MAG: epimerase, partial [Gemmatimonadetes bacterium]|nr:epimerase [Gemmatimonadota bacterium]
MPTTRRNFLRLSTGLSANLGSIAPLPNIPKADEQLRILILGGTSFLGVHQVNYALARGHRVTLFNRGRTNTQLFPEVEKLRGDRDDDLTALAGHEWDVVIDNSASIPRWVRQSAELLKHSANRYMYVSSLSVIADNSIVDSDEST